MISRLTERKKLRKEFLLIYKHFKDAKKLYKANHNSNDLYGHVVEHKRKEVVDALNRVYRELDAFEKQNKRNIYYTNQIEPYVIDLYVKINEERLKYMCSDQHAPDILQKGQ